MTSTNPKARTRFWWWRWWWCLWCTLVPTHSSWASSSSSSGMMAPDPEGTMTNEIVCTNIDIRNSVEQFKKLQNCTVVEGFVQILLIDNATGRDFENITFPLLREITGYLFLYRVQGLSSLSRVFPNLTVIRGNILFHNYAFVLFELRAMHEVGLGSLTVIERGSVRIEKNPHLCYVDTIDWDRISKAGRGGHFIKQNKPHEQCPNTCPSDAECPVSSVSGGRQLKLCWNSYMCQKVCSSDCEHQNKTCFMKSHCCHPECIGSCNGTRSSQCTACRHVAFKGRCMRKCPPSTLEYLGRRCIDEDECRAINNQLSILPTAQPIYWKPFRGECLPHCPSGFMESETDRHVCQICLDRCPKVCDGSVIDSVATAQKMKGCTFINGSLEIQIQGGDNVIKELENSLSSIQEIRGYLKIARSFPLVSLNFLKDLTHIHGEEADKKEKKEYSLLVLDNQNLQELWDWENRKTRLRIDGGKIFFHFNSKLCPNKIAELKKYADVRDWDERDVSPSSNGDRVACNVINMEITVWSIGAEVVGLKWQNFRKSFDNMDFRSLLGYVVYYREAPQRNITIFDGRDACGSDVWKVDDIEADDESEEVLTLLTRLKPFTTYAAYMRTYTIASALLGAQSPIIYFTTKPFTPSPPVNVQAHSTADGEIVVSWRSPKKPNGNVTHYIVDGLREKDSSDFVSQRNYCAEPLVLPGLKKTHFDEKTSDSEMVWFPNGTASAENPDPEKCCSCSKNTPLEVQEDDAEFQIHFEDFLHNNVYIKNPLAGKKGNKDGVSRQNKSVSTEAPAHATSTKPSNLAFFTQPSLEVSSEQPSITSTRESAENRTTGPSDPDPENGRFHHVIYDNNFLAINKLHHFTEYTIEVRACQDSSNDDANKAPECSSQAITTVRTLPLGSADDIDSSSLLVNTDNLTAGELFLKWDEPQDPNGLIVSYHIEVKQADAHNYKPIPVCITQLEYKKKMGYTLVKMMPGNYSLRLRATSLAGNGNWTKPVYFIVPDARDGMRNEIIVIVILVACLALIAVFGIPFYIFYKRKYGLHTTDGILYASVNPEYMSAGLVYEPDEWEVLREKITILEELGQGSFGMVYKGEAKGIGDAKSVFKCAIKTVNESASMRERIEFLQEASVMKTFNCHHVVKLLGVVSKGHPTLVIMELMGKGDLKAYLRSHRPENENIEMQPPTLKEILQMASEIADGMAYLSAKKFVHRDLAARNCMVADDNTVKIGDFGMTRDIYETDYYRKGGKGLLPVRWMAPECLKDGLFSCQSDIWSYGIVLWEMATLASQPYQGLSNEQVLKYVINGGNMEKPENCPEKLYALMKLCWEHNPKARPTFTELIEILLPDINQSKFREVSFYFTQRHELCTKENETDEAASTSTPLRIKWLEASANRDESDEESDVQYFPAARNVSDENYVCNNPRSRFSQDSFDLSERREHAATNDGSKGYSIHSNEGSKGMSVTSSDGSKGSKVSNVSNGSIANGHVSLSMGRTTTC